MKILYATGNPAKFASMRRRLEPLGITLQSLNDMQQSGAEIPHVEESGNVPLENARIKAKAYYEAFHMPVFSCDSGLYFEGEAAKDEPGVHVRRVNGAELTDEQVRCRIIDLVRKYGTITAYYKHAFCLITDEGHVYEVMNESTESQRFYLVESPHSGENKGFPIDSLSVDMETGKYFYDLPKEAVDKLAVEEGVLGFFKSFVDFGHQD